MVKCKIKIILYFVFVFFKESDFLKLNNKKTVEDQCVCVCACLI